MANCPICGKKIGMFDSTDVPFIDENGVNKSIKVCESCGKICYGAEARNKEAYNKLFELKENTKDAKLISYIYYVDAKIKDVEEREAKKEALECSKTELGRALENMLITSGYNFEGYKITEYKNMVSGECALGTGFLSEFSASVSDLFGSSSSAFSEKMYTAKEEALKIMKNRCAQLGCNAIIGVDYDYITFTNNMIGVIANGTAVKIEKL